MILFITTALAASPWKNANGDILSQRTIDAPNEKVAEHLLSTASLESLLSSDCVQDWEQGAAPEGPARLTYRILGFKRRLTARVVVHQKDRVIDFDHEGKKGFITRFVLEDAEGGTKVGMSTFITAPGFPVRGYYFEQVRPAWHACQTSTLDNLERTVMGAQ